MKNMTRLMMAMAGLVLTTGCPPEELPAAEPSPAEVEALSGMSYELESAEGFTLMEGTTFYLSFHQDTLSAYAGCNSLEGGYSLDEGVLSVESMSTTDMWCGETLNTQTNWLQSFLSDAPTLERSGDQLVLETEDATLVFLDQAVATPDLPLTAGTWTVDAVIEGDSVSTHNLAEYPLMWFSDDGTFGFSSACTEISGDYAASGEALSLSNVLVTFIECGDEPTTSFDQSIVDLIDDGEFTHTIDAARLTIMQGMNGISANGS